MSIERQHQQFQHTLNAAVPDVEVLYGEGSPGGFTSTCCVRLPSKLAKVTLIAKLVDFGSCPAAFSDLEHAGNHTDQSTDTSSDTSKLAQFLAELSPEGTGSYDASCLVTHDWKATKVLHHDDPFPKQTLSASHGSISVLRATLSQTSASSTTQTHNQWLTPVVAIFTNEEQSESSQQLCLVQKTQHCLGDVLRFSPQALQDDMQCRLILFQILSCLQSVHGQGLYLGHLTPDCVWLSPDRHVWLDFTRQLPVTKELDEQDLEALTAAWCSKKLSNLDYLLHLNRLAGRRLGDRTFHPYLPWVLDMTQPPEPSLQNGGSTGWRDLTQTKWRLSKGDEQLDFTYQSAPVPHHISDEAMSELAVCIYKARRLPKEVLVSVVRPHFHPQEYPASLTRLYNWSPDEAIPEFYSDPSVFESIHPELLDLAVPDWAAGPQDFVARHRMALESERVSDELHEWIDLTFGYKLSGKAAIQAKNVALPSTEPAAFATTGRLQLFRKPHPPRYGQAPHLLATRQVKHLSPLQQLEVLESSHLQQSPQTNRSSSSSGRHEDQPHPTATPTGRRRDAAAAEWSPGPAEDIAAFGRLAVQLYRSQMMHYSTADYCSWTSEVAYIPCACRPLATACLQAEPCHPPTATSLLGCDFFPQSVRTAAMFLAALHPARVPIHQQWGTPQEGMPLVTVSVADKASWLLDEALGCSALAALAARAASGELAGLQAQPAALGLCLPGFTKILLPTLNYLTQPPQPTQGDRRRLTAPSETTAPPVKGHSAVVQHWCAVVKVLVDILSKHELEQQLLPLLTSPFTVPHSSAAAAVCIALLHLMPLLFDRLHLHLYLTHFHPHIMHMVVTSANQPLAAGSSQASHGATPAQVAASFERAQLTNASSTALCGVVSSKLTLPVVLEHVIRPLLLALGNSPDVAVALIGVGSSMGGAMAAVHLLPSLIMVLIGSNVSAQTQSTAKGRKPARRRLSESGRGGAGAMLNAVTALEGLLPILPPEAVRQQVIKARQVVVQAAMLAEAPSLSAAAAGGPAEETQPSLLADMLLSPLQHPLATPQLRDRLAGLLLQASKVVGGSEVVSLELLPQLVPLFLCPPDQRGAYGSSIPPAAPSTPHPTRSQASMAEMTASSITADAPISLQQRLQQALAADIGSPGAAAKQASSLQRQAAGLGSGTGSEADSVREEDTGFWDLVYILYPDFAEAAGVGPLRELVPHWTLLEKTLMARYAWAAPSFNPNSSSTSSSGLLASLKDKVKRIRRTTSGTSASSPLAYSSRTAQPYGPSDDHSKGAALYIDGIGWSTPAVVSPRIAQGDLGGSSPLGRQSSIMPDWSLAEDAVNDQGRGDAMNEAREAQVQEETASLHGSLEGSAARPGIDQDAQSSVNSILGPALDSGLSPLLIEHDLGGSGMGLVAAPGKRRWHWLPVSPDDHPSQWANADIWEQYPPAGEEEGMFWQRPWRLRAAVMYGWRAHRQRLTAIASHPDEHMVATAGKGHVGGQEQDVVRCWNLADAAAGVQFTGHSSQVTALCWLPMAHSGRNSSTGSLMASCDATGSLHIWSAVTGVGKVSFRESSGSSSNGPGRRQTAADQVSAPTGWAQDPSLYRTTSRGPATIRTTGSGPTSGLGSGSGSYPSSSATQVEGSSRSSSSLASALAQRPPGGYTALAPGVGTGEGRDVVAGTGNGRARWVDVENGQLKADFYCRPLDKSAAGGGVSALAAGWGQLAAGLTSGHAAVLDDRTGTAVAFWQPHKSTVTALASLDSHHILTASQDHSLKLWDLRMGADGLHLDSMNSESYPRSSSSGQAQPPGPTRKRRRAGGPGCIAVFAGHTEPVSGFAMQQGDVIAHAGSHLGVLSLHGPPYTEKFVPTRLSNARGGKDNAALVGLDILPHSRLLVAGTEDGIIKICH